MSGKGHTQLSPLDEFNRILETTTDSKGTTVLNEGNDNCKHLIKKQGGANRQRNANVLNAEDTTTELVPDSDGLRNKSEKSNQVGPEDATTELLADTDGRRNKSKKANQVGPDGGWGWLVCFACFVQCLLFDGIFYAFGLTFLEISNRYEISKESGAWILSLNMGICMSSGPLIAALCNKFGFRLVTVIGSVVTLVGLVISCFVTDPRLLYFSYGILAGFGYGMVSQPSITAVTLSFTKKRALATGLSMCGRGLGVFIMSPVTEMLLEQYSWNGTFLIQAAILLNGIVCGLTYRPVVELTCERVDDAENDQTDKPMNGTYIGKVANGDDVVLAKVDNTFNHNSIDEIVIDDTYMGKVGNDNDTVTIDNVDNIFDDRVNIPCVNGSTDKAPDDERKVGSNLTFQQTNHSEKGVDLTINGRNSKRTYRIVQAIRKVKASTMSIVYDTYDISLMKDTSFCLYTISCSLYSLAYYTPYFCIPDVAKQAGIDSVRGAWLLSAIGITNTVSFVVLGFLSDHPSVNRLLLYAVSAFFCGVLTLVIPFCGSFEALLCVSVLFGIFSGATDVLTSVLTVDIVGTENTCKGLGIMNLFCGIATFIGPPLAGLMYDVTRSYDVTFCVSGVITSASGVMLAVIPCLKSAV